MYIDDASVALADVMKLLSGIEDFLMAMPDNLESEEMLQFAADLHSVKKYAGFLFDECQYVVTGRVGLLASPVVLSGSTVEIKTASNRKAWDHQGLMRDVSRRIVDKSIDLNTGELTKSPLEMIQEVINYMGVSYWKVSKLKELSIDADEYCEVSEGKKSIVVWRNQ